MWNTIGTVLAIVMGIGLIAGVIIYFHNGQNGAKTGTALQNETQIVGNIDQLYQNYPSGYSGISTSSLVKAGVFPKTMMQGGSGGGGSTVVNGWGGTVTVAPGGNSNEFVLTENGVPTKACIAMARQNSDSVQDVSVNGTSLTMPVDPAAAAGACNKSGQGPSGGNAVAVTAN